MSKGKHATRNKVSGNTTKTADISKLPAGATLIVVRKPKKKPRGKITPQFEKARAAYLWPKGVSGNPDGRPRCKLLSDAYRHLLTVKVPADLSIGTGRDKRSIRPKLGVTYAEQIAHAIAEKALSGDLGAASEIADRVEGKPTTTVAFQGADPLADLVAEVKRASAKIGQPENESVD